MFPTPYTVEVLDPSDGADDAHGNPAETFAAGRTEPVYGWAPAGSTEPLEAGRDAVSTDLDLYTPPTFTCTPDARVTVAGLTYEVVGDLLDFTRGPFRWAPGHQLRLRRVAG